MLYYPQLSTGAVASFPYGADQNANGRESAVGRRHDSNGGSGRRKVQMAAAIFRISPTANGLPSKVFRSGRGQLNTFTFLDPTDNLLMWSEDWTQTVWTADPLLQVAIGVQDPLGGSGAMQLTNTAQTTQRIVQSTAGPSCFNTASACMFGAMCPRQFNLVCRRTGQTLLHVRSLRAVHGRAYDRRAVFGSAGRHWFRSAIAGGRQVDAFGAQVEAQPAAGLYKKNIDRGGVYSSTRF